MNPISSESTLHPAATLTDDCERSPLLRDVVRVVPSSSLAYVRTMFEQLQRGVTILSATRETETRIPGLSIRETLEPTTGGGWYDGPRYRPSEDASIAQIVPTSGTEGPPKEVLISHRALADTTRRIVDVMAIDDTIREYVGVPVVHSFGFGRCRAVSAAGGRFFLPEAGFQPAEIARMLRAGEINAISAVPTLWRILLESREWFRGCGDRVRWIEIGSQSMTGAEKESLRTLFPEAVVVQHYGLTEASRSTFLRIDGAGLDELESVGRPTGDVEVSIGTSGRIRIRGRHVASAVWQEGRPLSHVDDEGWLTTSDRGRLEDGVLFFEGRADEVINCGGLKLSPDRVERAIQTSLGVADGVACTRLTDPILGEQVGVAFLRGRDLDAAAVSVATRDALRAMGLCAGNRTRILEVDAIPTTATGKVRRRELAQSFESLGVVPGSSVAPIETAYDGSLESRLIAIWEEVLEISPIAREDNFFDLGGDSLSSLRVLLQMEQAGLPPEIGRRMFEGHSIAELAAAAESAEGEALAQDDSAGERSQVSASRPGRTPVANASLSIHAVRGLLVLINIAAHWMPGVVERLPGFVADANRWLAPVYSSGTPGFAVVFGCSLGFFLLPRYRKNARSVLSLCRRNAMTLGTGIALLAGLRLAEIASSGAVVRGIDVTNSAYSVLLFYFLACLSLPVWMPILARSGHFGRAALSMSAAFYAVHLGVEVLAPDPSSNPFLQGVLLMLTAKFNYLEMSAGVLLGAALGHWIKSLVDGGASLRPVAMAGALLMSLGVALSIETGDSAMWWTWPKGLFVWSWPFYAGVVLLLIAGLTGWLARAVEGRRSFGSMLIGLMGTVGLAAFPLFVAHEMVLPLTRWLRNLGVPGSVGIALGLFFAASGVLLVKLHRLQHAGGARGSEARRVWATKVRA